MNIMKKLTALIIALLMLVSALPAMANVTAETIADEIELSMLTDDAFDRITKNLDLSVEEIKELYPEAIVSWRSSNPQVLTVVGKSGVLTRGAADKAVTLTAIVDLGGEVASKDFDLTVSKRNSTLARAENFEGEDIVKNTEVNDVDALENNGVSTLKPTTGEKYSVTVVEDPKDSSNSCVSLARIIGENDTNQLLVDVSTTAEGTNRWNIKFKVRVDEASASYSQLSLYGPGRKNNKDQTFSCTISIFYKDKIYFRSGETEKGVQISADLTQWANVEIDFNIDTMRYDVHFEGMNSKGEPVVKDLINLDFYSDTYAQSFNAITQLRSMPYRSTSGTTLYFDDFNVTTEAGEKLTENTLAAQNGDKIAVRSSYDGDNDLVYIFDNVIENSFVWDNALSLVTAGTIPSTEGNTFNIKKVLSAKPMGTPSFEINGFTLGAGNGINAAVNVETDDEHNLTLSDLGKVYTDEDDIEWAVIGVPDETHIVLLSENGGESDYKWSFASSVTGELTCGEDTISVVSQTGAQSVYPAASRKSLAVTGTSEDGYRQTLKDGEIINCKSIQVVETYAILNPVSVRDELISNRPENGYDDTPELMCEELCTVTLTYNFDENGRVTLSTTGNVLVDTAEFDSFIFNGMQVGEKFGEEGIASNNSYVARNEDECFNAVLLPVLDGYNNIATPVMGTYALLDEADLPKDTLPEFIPPEAFPEGVIDMSVNSYAVWQFENGSNEDIFEVDYAGETYLYFDFANSLSYTYELSEGEERIITEVDKTGDTSWTNENGVITVSASDSSDSLIIKIGNAKKSDPDLAHEFFDSYGKILDIDITDEDYTSAQQDILTAFVKDAYDNPPANHEDIHNLLMRAQAAPSFCGLDVTEVDSKIKKYGKYIGIEEDDYKKDCKKYGEVEIGKAFRDKTFDTYTEVVECYEDRIAALKKSAQKDDDSSTPSYRPVAKDNMSVELPKEPEKTETQKQAFKDLAKSHWAYDYITKLNAMNVINGYSDETVRPDETVTREQFVKMLVCALGIKEETGKEFSDVPKGYWSENYIVTAALNGIVSGYEDGSFKPQNNITREDMAIIIKRALTKINADFTKGNEKAEFSDSDEISKYAKESVQQIASLGIIGGMGNGKFMPKSFLTRAQAAKVIYLVCEAK